MIHERQIDTKKYRRWNGQSPHPVAHAMSFHLSPGPMLPLMEALKEIASGNYVFVGDMPYHSKWAANWSIHYISGLCESGRVRKAIEK